MQGDFNQIGAQYETLAIAGESGHYQLFGKEGCLFFEKIEKHLCQKWANDPHSLELKRWSASLDCLRSFLYQARRMTHHSNEFYALLPPPNQMLCQSGIEAMVDFESLLYLGRSTLDRLTFAIAKQTYGQECDTFNKLTNILKNFSKKDKRAKLSINVLEASINNFQEILINGKGGTNLRSLLAHSRSTGESVTHVYTVHRSAENQVLRFDLELDRIGILNTAHMLNRTVTFVALNLIALFTDYGKTITLRDCEPIWSPRCVCLSTFIDKTDQGPRFTTIRPIANSSYEILTHHVRRELFSHATRI